MIKCLYCKKVGKEQGFSYKHLALVHGKTTYEYRKYFKIGKNTPLIKNHSIAVINLNKGRRGAKYSSDILDNPYHTIPVMLLACDYNTKSKLMAYGVKESTLNNLLPKLESNLLKFNEEETYAFDWSYLIDKKLIGLISGEIENRQHKLKKSFFKHESNEKKIKFIEKTNNEQELKNKLGYYKKHKNKAGIKEIEHKLNNLEIMSRRRTELSNMKYNPSIIYFNSLKEIKYLLSEYFKYILDVGKTDISINTILKTFLLSIAKDFYLDWNKEYEYPVKIGDPNDELEQYFARIHEEICQDIFNLVHLAIIYDGIFFFNNDNVELDYGLHKFVSCSFGDYLNKIKHPLIKGGYREVMQQESKQS